MRPLLLIATLCIGCAPKGIPVPGPLGSVGSEVAPLPATDRTAEVARGAADEPEVDAAPTHKKAEESELGRAVARAAAHYLEHAPKGFRDDCSGFVCAVYDRAGVGLSGNTRSLWANAKEVGAVHKRRIPAIGDLVFFDNTYDRDRNGRRDDELTHVAVVMEVLADGTIVMAHGGTSRGRTELRMNLLEPDVGVTDDGAIKNDYLRAQYKTDPAGTPRLAGQLWRGFATVSPDEIDAWAGGS